MLLAYRRSWGDGALRSRCVVQLELRARQEQLVRQASTAAAHVLKPVYDLICLLVGMRHVGRGALAGRVRRPGPQLSSAPRGSPVPRGRKAAMYREPPPVRVQLRPRQRSSIDRLHVETRH